MAGSPAKAVEVDRLSLAHTSFHALKFDGQRRTSTLAECVQANSRRS
jgi:hypothetical protein